MPFAGRSEGSGEKDSGDGGGSRRHKTSLDGNEGAAGGQYVVDQQDIFACDISSVEPDALEVAQLGVSFLLFSVLFDPYGTVAVFNVQTAG